MNDWFTKNAWGVGIALAALVSNYAIYGYRINDLDQANKVNAAAIAALNTQQVQTQVSLAQIAVDLTYIKASLDRVLTGSK